MMPGSRPSSSTTIQGTNGHIQQAKLDIILYAHGDERIVDPGRLAYGNPMHKGWYRQTVAHNTVVVNESTQARAPGKLLAFESNGTWSGIQASMDTAYENVRLQRTVVLRDGVIVDVFHGAAETETTFDLPLHFNGTLAGVAEGTEAALADKNGYEYLKDVRRLDTPLQEFAVDTGNGTSIHVTVLDTSESYQAEGRAQPPSRFIPLVLRRQHGTEATFVAVYQLLGAGERPREISGTLGQEINVACGRFEVTVRPLGFSVAAIED